LWVFRANGLYDPDLTFTGHQPLGFDQIMPLYNVFTVLSARITVDFISTSVPTFGGVTVTTLPTAAYTDYNSYIEAGTTSYVLMDTESGPRNRITATVDIAKFQGLHDLTDNSNYGGSVVADPTAQVYFHVLAQDVNKTSTANAEMSVVIDYDVVFSNPRSMPTS